MVDSKDREGLPQEPTVLKLDNAAATAEEVYRTKRISELVGDEAVRTLRGPMYVSLDGVDLSETSEDLSVEGLKRQNADALGGVVLEMAGACWVLPDFYGRVGKVELLTTFKQRLVGRLRGEERYESDNPSSVLRELWGHGGPLRNLAFKTADRTKQPLATEAKVGEPWPQSTLTFNSSSDLGSCGGASGWIFGEAAR